MSVPSLLTYHTRQSKHSIPSSTISLPTPTSSTPQISISSWPHKKSLSRTHPPVSLLPLHLYSKWMLASFLIFPLPLSPLCPPNIPHSLLHLHQPPLPSPLFLLLPPGYLVTPASHPYLPLSPVDCSTMSLLQWNICVFCSQTGPSSHYVFQ